MLSDLVIFGAGIITGVLGFIDYILICTYYDMQDNDDE